MEKVIGIGGAFFRARDPEALRRWYAEHLGVVDPPGGVWRQDEGPTVFAPFSADTGYFGRREQMFMLNFRVSDLDAMLVQLSAAGVEVLGEQDEEGVGRFAWIADPERNRIELWEPAPDAPLDPSA